MWNNKFVLTITSVVMVVAIVSWAAISQTPRTNKSVFEDSESGNAGGDEIASHDDSMRSEDQQRTAPPLEHTVRVLRDEVQTVRSSQSISQSGSIVERANAAIARAESSRIEAGLAPSSSTATIDSGSRSGRLAELQSRLDALQR